MSFSYLEFRGCILLKVRKVFEGCSTYRSRKLLLVFFQPAPKKKRFIDKKNAITFRLVSRSQKDPLAADETAPQHVLLEQILKPISRKDGRTTSQSVDGVSS